jgi:Flp pilus assembly pilin Flp
MVMRRVWTVIGRIVPGSPARKEAGQGMAEYALIVAGIAILAIVALFLLGPRIGLLLNRIAASLN